jgi:DNA-directed RNA polymerase sigma subunit (sigma70/sigma32)
MRGSVVAFQIVARGAPCSIADVAEPKSRRAASADQDAALRALRSKLAGILRRLPEVERQVLELRMGLAEGVPLKPGEVAERLGMTVPEVRKIEQRAFERIREVVPTKGLERFLQR